MDDFSSELFDRLMAKKPGRARAAGAQHIYIDPNALIIPPRLLRRLAPSLPKNLIVMPAVDPKARPNDDTYTRPEVGHVREVLEDFPNMPPKVKASILKTLSKPPGFHDEPSVESFTHCGDAPRRVATSCYVNLQKPEVEIDRISHIVNAELSNRLPPDAFKRFTALHELGHTVLHAAMKKYPAITKRQQEIFSDRFGLALMKEFPDYFKGMKPQHVAGFRAMTGLYMLPAEDKDFLASSSRADRFSHATSLAVDGKFVHSPAAFNDAKNSALIGRLQIKLADRLLKTPLGKEYLRLKEIDKEPYKILGDDDYNNAMRKTHRTGMLAYAIKTAPEQIVSALKGLAAEKTAAPMEKEFIGQAINGITTFHAGAAKPAPAPVAASPKKQPPHERPQGYRA